MRQGEDFMMLKKINVAVLFALGVLLSAPGSAADRSAPSEELPGDAPESDVSVKFHALDYSQSVMNLSQGSSEKRLNDMRGELISLDVEEDTLKHRLRQALLDNPEAAKAVEKADLEAKSRPSVNISLDDALDRKIQVLQNLIVSIQKDVDDERVKFEKYYRDLPNGASVRDKQAKIVQLERLALALSNVLLEYAGPEDAAFMETRMGRLFSEVRKRNMFDTARIQLQADLGAMDGNSLEAGIVRELSEQKKRIATYKRKLQLIEDLKHSGSQK